jgi:hypothetical protein
LSNARRTTRRTRKRLRSGEPTDHALRCCQDGGTTGARHAVSDTGSPGSSTHAADQCAARSIIRTWRRGAARSRERGDSCSGDRRYDAFTPVARCRIGARIPRSDSRAFGESRGAREGDSVRSQAGRHNPSPADNAGRWADHGHGDRDVRAANGGIPPRARFRSLAWAGPCATLDRRQAGSRENFQNGAARYSPAALSRRPHLVGCA